LGEGKLPGLNHRETVAFFDEFAPESELRGISVTGRSRDGAPFSVHLDHKTMGLRPDILQNALRYLGVSRQEFWDWYQKH
jgi:hypothetical protein